MSQKPHFPSRIGKWCTAGVVLAAAAHSWAATWNPTTSTQLQNAIDGCALGDEIILQAGTTYVGDFTLKKKTTGTGWITIRSSALSSLPAEGTRVSPSDASNMPKLVAPSGVSSTRTIRTEAGAHHYKLVGLELVSMQTPIDYQTMIVMLGIDSSAQSTIESIPHHFVIDRCYIRPYSPSLRVRKGIYMATDHTDITNCWIEEIHDIGAGDSQAIGGNNGRGPYNIINNHLEAASENIMFGGSRPHIGAIASDIVIRRNHLIKPLNWRDDSQGGTNPNGWTQVKNLFEIKAAKNVVFEDNILENCWVAAQTGMAFNIKVALDSNDTWVSPQDDYYMTDNVMIRNNIIRNANEGIRMLGRDYLTGGPAEQVKNVTYSNNLWYDIDETFFIATSGCKNTTFEHNTIFHTNLLGSAGDTTYLWNGFVYINNISHKGTFGFKGSGQTEGTNTLNTYFPGAIFTKNVIVASTATYPTGNWKPSSWTGVLNDQAGGDYENGDWDVVSGSVYEGAAVDKNGNPTGKDIGADIATILDKTQGCITGIWPGGGGGGTTTVTFKNGVNGYTGATSFQGSGQNPTTHFGPATYSHVSNRHSPTSGFVHRTFYKFDVSSIPSGANVTSAKLKIKVENAPGSNVNLNAYRVTPSTGFSVNYATATRNTYNGTNSWTGGATIGGIIGTEPNDLLDTPDDSEPVPTAGWYELDVTASVDAWVNGAANNGWIVQPNPTTPNVSVNMGTPADLHGSGDYPELQVTYEVTAAPTTVTLKNGVNGYGGATSFIADGQNPTVHLGPSRYYNISNRHSPTSGFVYRTFYKFDVSSIPSGKTVTSAKLKIKVENAPGSNVNLNAYRVTPSTGFTVNYATATRNTYNGTNSWTGGSNAGGVIGTEPNDLLDTPDDSEPVPTAGWYQLDVTATVNAWVNGTPNNGWIVQPNPTTPNVSVNMGTPADSHGSGDYPELEITYQ